MSSDNEEGHHHCAIDETVPPKCHRIRGDKCQSVNAWIEFLVSHGGRGHTRAQLSSMYASAKLSHADIVPPPYSIRWGNTPPSIIHAKEQVCSFTRARQLHGKVAAKASVHDGLVRDGYAPPGLAVKTVFLMLIHSTGVSHPELWERYLAAQRPHVALCIHRDPQHGGPYTPFVKRYKLPRTSVQAQWGDESLVDATIQSFAEILERHPRLNHIVLCSGTDIPLGRTDTSMALHDPGATAYTGFFFAQQNKDFIRQLKGGVQGNLHSDIFRVMEFHAQWMSVCREHAMHLAQNREEILDRFRPVQQLVVAKNLRLAPDEWYMLAAIRLYAHPQPMKCKELVTTGTYFRADGDPHPITFTELNKIEEFNIGLTNHDTSTLANILKKTVEKHNDEIKRINRNRKNHYKSVVALTMRKVRCASAADKHAMEELLVPMWDSV